MSEATSSKSAGVGTVDAIRSSSVLSDTVIVVSEGVVVVTFDEIRFSSVFSEAFFVAKVFFEKGFVFGLK